MFLYIAAEESGASSTKLSDESLVESIVRTYNSSLVFSPDEHRMAYTIRDPLTSGPLLYTCLSVCLSLCLYNSSLVFSPDEHRMAYTIRDPLTSGLLLYTCLSVCPSVTLVDHDHICWKSWKLIARTVSPTPSLFVAQRPSTYSHGNMGKF